MSYQKTIPKQPTCDQTLELVLTDVETAGLGCHVLEDHDITPTDVVLTYDDAKCRKKRPGE